MIRISNKQLDFYNNHIIKFHTFRFFKIILLNEESARLYTNEFCI